MFIFLCHRLKLQGRTLILLECTDEKNVVDMLELSVHLKCVDKVDLVVLVAG